VELERINLTYNGGIATAGRMHFYEYGRATYGFARLLNTAEHFRRTGRVAQKIGARNYVDLIVEAPRKGSFVTEVMVPVLAGTVPQLSGVPVRAMIAYIFQLLLGRSEHIDDIVPELAKVRQVEDRNSPPTREAVDRFAVLESIIKSQTATTRQALDLVKYAISSNNRAVRRLVDDQSEYIEMAYELEAELEQESEINRVDRYLKVLEPDAVARLSSRVRPMVSEMGLPLRRGDVDNFTIGASNDNAPIGYFNRRRVAAIQSRTVENEAVWLESRIHGYDRDAGAGKASLKSFPKRLKFVVPAERRAYLQPKILSAMNDSVDTVNLNVLRVLDRSKQPTSLILLDLADVQDAV